MEVMSGDSTGLHHCKDIERPHVECCQSCHFQHHATMRLHSVINTEWHSVVPIMFAHSTELQQREDIDRLHDVL